jgi:hypothetical protein
MRGGWPLVGHALPGRVKGANTIEATCQAATRQTAGRLRRGDPRSQAGRPLCMWNLDAFDNMFALLTGS